MLGCPGLGGAEPCPPGVDMALQEGDKLTGPWRGMRVGVSECVGIFVGRCSSLHAVKRMLRELPTRLVGRWVGEGEYVPKVEIMTQAVRWLMSAMAHVCTYMQAVLLMYTSINLFSPDSHPMRQALLPSPFTEGKLRHRAVKSGSCLRTLSSSEQQSHSAELRSFPPEPELPLSQMAVSLVA